jgi:membrane protease YdiL (CAAX protease family)
VRKQLIIFFVVLIVLSAVFQYLAISSGNLMPWVIGIMWSPGIAALAARLVCQRNLRNLGWGWGKTRYQIISYLLPLALCLVVYGIVWLTGLGTFFPGEYPSLVGRQIGSATPPSFVLSIVIIMTVGMLTGMLTALGEEIGWRGFLVTELFKKYSYTKTSIIIGVIWAVWHYPGILFTDYYSGNNHWYAILCFTLMIVGWTFVMNWVRLKSGSLWTAAIFHASHNLFIQGVFDPLTKNNETTEYITSEFGIGVAVVYCILAYFFWRRRSELEQ